MTEKAFPLAEHLAALGATPRQANYVVAAIDNAVDALDRLIAEATQLRNALTSDDGNRPLEAAARYAMQSGHSNTIATYTTETFAQLGTVRGLINAIV